MVQAATVLGAFPASAPCSSVVASWMRSRLVLSLSWRLREKTIERNSLWEGGLGCHCQVCVCVCVHVGVWVSVRARECVCERSMIVRCCHKAEREYTVSTPSPLDYPEGSGEALSGAKQPENPRFCVCRARRSPILTRMLLSLSVAAACSHSRPPPRPRRRSWRAPPPHT